MSRALRSRLRQLEAQAVPAVADDVPIFCLEREGVEETIAAMIARGEIGEEDRPRCKWWPDARIRVVPGTHEERLAGLD